MNVTLTDIHRSFGKNKVVDGVSAGLGPEVFRLPGVGDAPLERGYSPVPTEARA